MDFAAISCKSSIAALDTTADPEVEVLGAKAAAEPQRRARIESFMLMVLGINMNSMVRGVRVHSSRCSLFTCKKAKLEQNKSYAKRKIVEVQGSQQVQHKKGWIEMGKGDCGDLVYDARQFKKN